jgi:histone H3/H4
MTDRSLKKTARRSVKTAKKLKSSERKKRSSQMKKRFRVSGAYKTDVDIVSHEYEAHKLSPDAAKQLNAFVNLILRRIIETSITLLMASHSRTILHDKDIKTAAQLLMPANFHFFYARAFPKNKDELRSKIAKVLRQYYAGPIYDSTIEKLAMITNAVCMQILEAVKGTNVSSRDLMMIIGSKPHLYGLTDAFGWYWSDAGVYSNDRGLLHGFGKRNFTRDITKISVNRLSKRAGINRVSSSVYTDVRKIIEDYLKTILRKASLYTWNDKRTVVSKEDVYHASNIKMFPSQNMKHLKRLQRSFGSSRTKESVKYYREHAGLIIQKVPMRRLMRSILKSLQAKLKISSEAANMVQELVEDYVTRLFTACKLIMDLEKRDTVRSEELVVVRKIIGQH